MCVVLQTDFEMQIDEYLILYSYSIPIEVFFLRF